MSDAPKSGGSKLWIILVILLVALIAVWQLGLLRGGGEPETREVVKVDATDLSGGELIATEPKPGEVPVKLPDTPMTNVPAEPSPTATATGAAE